MRDTVVQPIDPGDRSNRHRLSPRAAKARWRGTNPKSGLGVVRPEAASHQAPAGHFEL